LCPLLPLPSGERVGVRGSSREVKLLENSVENALEIAQNVVIPKTDDVVPALFQHRSALAVRNGSLPMLTTINLDDQFAIQSDEVDNEVRKRNLPLEFDAIELTHPKSRPKETLGLGGILTQSTGELFQTLSPLTLPSPQRGEGHFA
jgi:hypothetical protein